MAPEPHAKTVGFSHGDFGLVVQAFHSPVGNHFFCTEVIEDEFSVFAQ
jgi:hypothetical protein